MIGKVNEEENRGLGGYREICWFFSGKNLVLWICDQEECVEHWFAGDINCMDIGEIRGPSLPAKTRNKYILAIGITNTVYLFSLNNYTL